MPSSALAGEVAVYTYGWDTAFAIPVREVNRAIVDHRSSPAELSVHEETFEVHGRFGPWQIAPGGDGKNVRLRLPLSDVRLKYTASARELSFPAGHAIAEVKLHFIPHTGAALADAGDGRPMALMVNPKAESKTDPAFTVVELTLDPVPGDVTAAVIQQALNDWGNDNLGQFAHVFSVVNLNRMIDHDQWGFVTPNYTSYAYLDGRNVDDSTFAVLCMTGKRSGESLSEQVSAAAIPHPSIAGFLVSQERTLYDLVRPAVELTFPGLTEKNFLMSEDGTELQLSKDTAVPLAPVKHEDTTYHPVLKELSVTSNGRIVTLKSYTETPIVAGIMATCRTTHWYTMGLGTSGNGQTLVFKESQEPVVEHDVKQSEGSHITQLIIAIVGAVALLLLTIFTSGAALIVGGLVIGLVLGASSIVPATIEKVNHDDAPSIDLLLVNAVHPIQWTGGSAFELDYASLNASLQLGGDPRFV